MVWEREVWGREVWVECEGGRCGLDVREGEICRWDVWCGCEGCGMNPRTSKAGTSKEA